MSNAMSFFTHGCKKLNKHILLCLAMSTDLFTDYVGPFLGYFSAPLHVDIGLDVHITMSVPLSRSFFICPQASSLPMSIIIVGVGPAEFDGECRYLQSFQLGP